MLNNIEAVIFDMDGVLVESEYRNYLAKLNVLKPFGISFNYDYYSQFPGNSNMVVWEKIISDFSLENDASFYHKIDLEARNRLISEQGHIAVDGAQRLVKTLCKKYPLALASGSPEKIIFDAMRTLGLYDCFDYIISGETIENCKPAPDIFLNAAENIGVDPNKCAVIEDSHNGVVSAKRAKMYCIGFVNKNSGNQDLSLADAIVKNHLQTLELFNQTKNPLWFFTADLIF